MPNNTALIYPYPPNIADHRVSGRILPADYYYVLRILIGTTNVQNTITAILWKKFTDALRKLNLSETYDPTNPGRVADLLDSITFTLVDSVEGSPSRRTTVRGKRPSGNGRSGTRGIRKATANPKSVSSDDAGGGAQGGASEET